MNFFFEHKDYIELTFIVKCYPINVVKSKTYNRGNKIILPPSILDSLEKENFGAITKPVIFQLWNLNSKKKTNCGVLDYTADEMCIFIPMWIMDNLKIAIGQRIQIRTINIEKGKYVRFGNISEDFFYLANIKIILETKLRFYTCLTVSDNIPICYAQKKYMLNVLQVKPGNAITIINVDIEVTFATPGQK